LKYIVIDTETTGLLPGSRLVEIAAVLFDEKGTIDTFEQLINPGMPIPEDATSVNSITNEMVKGMPGTYFTLNNFFNWIAMTDSRTLIAHNAKFDTGVISWEAGRFGIEIPGGLTVIDTCKMAKNRGVTKNNKLTTIADFYELKRKGDAHRALSDADLCMQYFTDVKKRWNPVSIPWDKVGHNYQYTDDLPEILMDFPCFVAMAKPLSFKYTDSKGNVTERTIIPNGWSLQDGNLMFNGWCQLRKATRSFLADRILEVIEPC